MKRKKTTLIHQNSITKELPNPSDRIHLTWKARHQENIALLMPRVI
jgi:hypothetical protein